VVLHSFFHTLGDEVPAFRQFQNTTLFDNILNYRFAPRATYKTCHHGISVLAVSMRSFAEQEQESLEDSYYDLATSKTPDAVRKHKAKLPPPLPTTILELLQLI